MKKPSLLECPVPMKVELTDKQFQDYLNWRMLALYAGRQKPFAEALETTPSNLGALRKGKSSLSPEMMQKLNRLDPEFNLRFGRIIVEPKKNQAKPPAKRARSKPKKE